MSTDRFCPACGNPNVGGARHPRFGPVPVEPVGLADRPTAPPSGVPYCPLCWDVADLRQPFCASCGMSLDRARQKALVDGYLGSWGSRGGAGARWRAADGLNVVLRGVVALVVLLAMAAAVLSGAEMAGVELGISSISLSAETVTSWTGWLSLIVSGLCLVGAGLFIAWTRRCYRNLSALGVSGLRLGTGWATASWFIPFVNLVLPKEILDDLWRASDPETPPLTPTWQLRTVPFWLHLWWAGILGSAVVLAVAQWLPVDRSALVFDDLQLGLFVGAHVFLAFSAVLTLMVVRDVDARQQARVTALFARPVGFEVIEGDADGGAGVAGIVPIGRAVVGGGGVVGRY